MGNSHTSLVARWRARTTTRQHAVAQYLHRVRPLVAVWAETLAEMTESETLEVTPHIIRLLALRRWLDQVEVPSTALPAHAALIMALEQTLMTCGAILTRQPQAAVDERRDAALVSFKVFQIEVTNLVGVEQYARSPAR